ncbi:membrane protein [Natronoarchaeum philippinense]|uniref:Membrane protein n=1 Tax=Natronoarchaeum philippinense TaxID=558529 RepID=A0A285NVL4_NATPI|nr:YihY/virulence factor BrkB family protein [Natronoarchaeum philippinense]SNZ13505.1 membrane protein [Natronoarchaeum philippinense]
MDVASTARAVADRARDRQITFLAASIAYYVFFSILPLLLLVLAIGSLVGGESFADQIVSAISGSLSSEGETVVSGALSDPQGRASASFIGTVALLWSSLKMFRALDIAFDEVYRPDAETSLLDQIRDGLLALALIGLAIVFMIGLGAVIGLAEAFGVPFLNVVGWLALVAGLLVVFLPLYYVMPPVEMTAGEALPGAVFAAGGWLALQVGFQIYASQAGNYDAYGVLGAILLFLTWLYFAGVIVLLGATVNAVLGGY